MAASLKVFSSSKADSQIFSPIWKILPITISFLAQPYCSFSHVLGSSSSTALAKISSSLIKESNISFSSFCFSSSCLCSSKKSIVLISSDFLISSVIILSSITSSLDKGIAFSKIDSSVIEFLSSIGMLEFLSLIERVSVILIVSIRHYLLLSLSFKPRYIFRVFFNPFVFF